MGKHLVVAARAWTLAPSTARAERLLTPHVGGVSGGAAAGGVRWYDAIADRKLESDLLDIDLPLDIDRTFRRATGGVTFRG